MDIGWPLAVAQNLGIYDKQFTGVVFRFCKKYSRDKMIRIVERAKSHTWHLKSPGPSFMAAIGEINKEEKDGLG